LRPEGASSYIIALTQSPIGKRCFRCFSIYDLVQVLKLPTHASSHDFDSIFKARSQIEAASIAW
jgi:hypothetical protein